MYFVVALVSCVAVAAASKCCIPPQWEGQTGFLTAMVRGDDVKISRGTASMSYDGINYRIGQMYNIELDGKTGQTYGVLMDYKSNTKYIINNGKCIRTMLNRTIDEFGGCVPDNATIASNVVLGFGTNDLSVNSYRLDYGPVVAYIAMSSDNCVPAIETIRGQLDGTYFLQNTHYFNVSAGIADASVLTVPPVGCEDAMMVNAHYTDGAFGLVGRRSVLGF